MLAGGSREYPAHESVLDNAQTRGSIDHALGGVIPGVIPGSRLLITPFGLTTDVC